MVAEAAVMFPVRIGSMPRLSTVAKRMVNCFAILAFTIGSFTLDTDSCDTVTRTPLVLQSLLLMLFNHNLETV